MTVQQTLAHLVGIDSVSSRSNAEIIEFLEQRCVRSGFSVKRFSYTDETGIEKINLVALAGAEFSEQTEAELALVGHTDTVPYDANWSEATKLTERDGKLFARGACDTKGFIAAALTAVELIDVNRLQRPLALIFTADEEIGLRGAKYLAQINAMRVRYSIVGEPTSLQPIRAGKGYALAEVVVRGREAHSAYPALGASAIFRAARLISRLAAIGEQLKSDRHDGFDPPFTTLNVGLISGGTAKNVLAGECRFALEWRPIPTQKPTLVLDLLDAAIAEEMKSDSDFTCEVRSDRNDSGFETREDSTLVTLLESTTGKRTGSVAFGTEGAQMTRLGSEAVVLGPGDIRQAHRTGEFVPVEELERCVEILSEAINSFCF
ncbi:MAG TPA: acetylornithine deacetylase [Pyrinomonadaceae bacterium]|jgi:acetylornithine deacetylase|nr:acetylornithine deacetylase [Pyrinomonadaceae bacterium]